MSSKESTKSTRYTTVVFGWWHNHNNLNCILLSFWEQVPPGVLKLTFDVKGLMLKGNTPPFYYPKRFYSTSICVWFVCLDGVWPEPATHFLFDTDIYINQYPNSFDLQQGDIANTLTW
jgi:hypothetical protein